LSKNKNKKFYIPSSVKVVEFFIINSKINASENINATALQKKRKRKLLKIIGGVLSIWISSDG